MLTRRSVLFGAGSLIASAPLSGCGFLTRTPSPLCPWDPRRTDRALPLTIDAHAHLFNGSDLQIGDFFRLVLLRDLELLGGLGDILQGIAWSTAPNGAAELVALDRIEIALAACQGPTAALARANPLDQSLASLRQAGYDIYRENLQRAVQANAQGRLGRRANASVESFIRGLPQDVGSFRTNYATPEATARLSRVDRKALNALRFVFQLFQYRYVNLVDYLDLYARGTDRKVDLVITHMVDYNWPLSMGGTTPTSHETQLGVMKRISRLSGGRVHAFVPFDPLREVAHRWGLLDPDLNPAPSALALAQRGIEEFGCVGVKLYPPMGFRAYGNEELERRTPDFWHKPWLPAGLQRPGLGRELDHALGDLYYYCLHHRVPIMAHTNWSNGPDTTFQDGAAEAWGTALRVFPELQINFGHFGDVTGGSSLFSDLMRGPGQPGANAYADTGFFSESVENPAALERTLRDLFRQTSHKGPAALAQRLLYGTDWEMTLISEAGDREYLEEFHRILSLFDQDGTLGSAGRLSDRFFGENAADFMGLRGGRPARERLDAFYRQEGVAKPMWAHKVDGTVPSGLDAFRVI